MTKISSSDLLNSIQKDCQWIDSQIDSYKSLPEDKMNYKPAPEKWSANECLAHMSILYAIYIRNMQKAIARAEKHHWKASVSYNEGVLGRWLTNYMSPKSETEVGSKMKTVGIFDPVRNYKSEKGPLQNFQSYHEEFKKLVEQMPELNLEKIRVKSSIGNIIRFKLGDCYQFITAHNKRHLVQANKAIASSNE